MNPEKILLAHNPLMPAALIAIRRAAQRARSEARRMGTAVVIMRDGRVVRLESADIREREAEYNVRQDPSI
ncbi:hypothetical protein GGI1_14496 [Acidithiobacillus sp. GGI-221]|nr:hypothetical protein GGI1_14496 [Acidithiobacillus sp. GGI-221]